MKILHINTNDFGGAGIAAIRLHKAMLNKKIDSNFLCLNKTSTGTPSCKKIVPKKAFWLFRLLHRLKFVRYAHEINTESIKEKVGNFEIFSFPLTDYDITSHPLVKEADIIHLHWVANFLDWHSFFKHVNKPIVWTLHDMNPFLGGFHYLDDRSRNKDVFQALEEKYVSIKINALKEFKNMHIVCPSNWIYSESSKSKILSKYLHYVIPNSVPIDTFKPLDIFKSRALFNLPNDRKSILFVAASLTNPRKGFELLIKALNSQDRKEYALVIVGQSSLSDFYKVDNIYYLGQIDDAVISNNGDLIRVISTVAQATILFLTRLNLEFAMYQ